MIVPAIQGDIREVPVSVLAYIGDAVYELYVRMFFYGKAAGQSGSLHRQAVGLVKAAAQAEAVKALLPLLDESESAVYRRGRNSQTSSMPKHADPADYQAATGFEALIGYLYLTGKTQRIDSLLDFIFKGCNDE